MEEEEEKVEEEGQGNSLAVAGQRTVREVRGGRVGGREGGGIEGGWKEEGGEEGGWKEGGLREGGGNSAKTSPFKQTFWSEGKKRRLRRYQRDTGRSQWPQLT